MGAFLATLSSLLWGTGDFLGGTLSRRAHPIAVVRVTQALAAVGLLVVAAATGELGRTGAIGWGIAAGTAGCIGLSAFYSALAAGTMGVVAPIAAIGVVIPVTFGLVRGDEATAVQGVGIVVTIIGVVLAAGPERHRRAGSADVAGGKVPPDPDRPVGASGSDPGGAARAPTSPLLLAAVAAVGFGSALLLVAEGSQTSVVMTLLTMRVAVTLACTALLLTVLRAAPRTSSGDLPALATVATTDAGANGAFAIASTLGQVSISAVLASLYPAVTALLAWRFQGEQLRPVQVVGVVATLAGVALIAAG